jgi:hypothetical protein
MEDTKPYGVTMLVTPPTTPPRQLSELKLVAQTTGAGQQCYYKAEQVQALVESHTREIEALRRYIDVQLTELLAHPELPESIQKVLYVHRQMLIVAKEQAQ